MVVYCHRRTWTTVDEYSESWEKYKRQRFIVPIRSLKSSCGTANILVCKLVGSEPIVQSLRSEVHRPAAVPSPARIRVRQVRWPSEGESEVHDQWAVWDLHSSSVSVRL